MNNITKKLLALGLCAALGVGHVCAASLPKSERNAARESQTATRTVSAAAEKEASRDEAVYVLAGADGSVQKIIVSDWLSSALGGELSGDATVVDAQGNDIYTQEDVQKELPVDMTISYKLDGKTVTPEKLAGKSGKVTIRFDYENRQYEMVEIDGKQEKIYVPFAMLTGMMLDNDCFSNVEVSNGKLVNDGNHTIVVGLAFPGLQENLGVDRDKLDIPDYVEISADVTDFSFGMTITVATNELFNEVDGDKLDDVEGETGSLNELTDAMDQLMDGSSALYDGLCTLLEKSDDLVDGVNQLADGAKTLSDGAASVDDGAGQIKSGLAELSSGLDTLSANSSSLNGGAAQVFNTLLATATTQIRAAGLEVADLTIGNYADVLNALIDSLDETKVYNQALAQVTAAVEKNRETVVAGVTAAVQENVKTQVTAAVQEQVTSQVTAAVQAQVTAAVISEATGGSITTVDEYNAAVEAGLVDEDTQAAVSTAIEEQMAFETVQGQIAAAVTEQMGSDNIQTNIESNTATQMESDEVAALIEQNTEAKIQELISENMASEEVQSKLTAASEGAKTIIALKKSLDSYNAFYLGLQEYTAGVDTAATGAGTLYSGAGTLKDGTAQLKSGASTLYDGVLTLKDSMPALVEGVTELRDGSMELSDGLKEFNEKGIQKIVDLIDGDLESIVDRIQATIDVSKNYQSFSDSASDIAGQVNFIYRTEEIGED